MNGLDQNIAVTATTQHNLGYEQIVLGSMLTSPAEVATLSETLKAEDFYHHNHRTLFTTIMAARTAGRPIEPNAIATQLANDGTTKAVGGLPYLFDLIQAVPVTAQASWYAAQLRDLADRRSILVETARIAQAAAAGTDAEALHEMARGLVEHTTPRTTSDGMVSLGEFTGTGVADIEHRRTRRGGLSTGFYDLDDLFSGGLRPGEVLVIAGRPGTGKSTLALDMSRYTAIRHKSTVGFFSMEMSMQELFDRALSAEAGIAYERVRRGTLTDDDWAKATAALGPMAEAPLFMDETRGHTTTKIANQCRKIQARHGLDLVVVDYLQLIKTSRRVERREQEVAEVARSLKELAGELRCPLIAVAQLNRNVEARADRRPQLSDLRESGEIEQAADAVLLVHREDYYDPESPRAGEADLILAKNRSGPPSTITVAAQLHLARFTSMTAPHPHAA